MYSVCVLRPSEISTMRNLIKRQCLKEDEVASRLGWTFCRHVLVMILNDVPKAYQVPRSIRNVFSGASEAEQN